MWNGTRTPVDGAAASADIPPGSMVFPPCQCGGPKCPEAPTSWRGAAQEVARGDGPEPASVAVPDCGTCQRLWERLRRAGELGDASAAVDARVLLRRHEGSAHGVRS